MKNYEEGAAGIDVHASLIKAYLKQFCDDLDKHGWSESRLLSVTRWIVTHDKMNAEDVRAVLGVMYSIALKKAPIRRSFKCVIDIVKQAGFYSF